ncbi:NAD(P)-binding protein [Xylariaceae sp. FL0255]|nr:NAD(P)-binding protein [Xylariaceae sp. FL0255]
MTTASPLSSTGGSLGLHAVDYLLRKYPSYTVILLVRDAAESDEHTNKLHQILKRHPKTAASIHQVDLSSLPSVHAFVDTIVAGVRRQKYPPLASIVCTAYYWNLVADSEVTANGFDKTLEVNHIAHAALILRLLGSFGATGRIIHISSDSHWPGKNNMETYLPFIPDDPAQLLTPSTDHDKYGRGYQRYAISKLVLTTWDPKLGKVTAIAMNPGNMVDSRALRRNTPTSLHRKQKFMFKPLQPLLSLIDLTLRVAALAGADVIELALNSKFASKTGFFTLLMQDESSPESNDEVKQELIWTKTLEWARITEENRALQNAFD